MYPALFFWGLVPFSAIASSRTVLVILLASMPFAGFAVVPTVLVGGVTVLPQSVFAVLLVLKVVGPDVMPLSPNLVTALGLRHLGFLGLFLLVGAVATVIMPRLFAGEISVFPIRESWKLDLLHPTIGNLTQLGYVALSTMTAFAVALMAQEQKFVETLLRGMLVGGVVCIVTGLVDIAAASAGLQDLLKPLRNAEYAYLTNAGIADLRRVVGLTPEASAYGAICVQFAAALALLRTFYAEGRERAFATIVLFGLIVMAVLSTSSTAYIGLAVLALAYVVNWIRRALSSSARGQVGLMGEFVVGFILMIALVAILIVRADLFDPLSNVIQEIIFNKPLSSSFYERTHWTDTAWSAVASTWGLGIGFGSARTSNWFVAIISGAGVVGGLFMAIFLIQTFAQRPIWQTDLSAELFPGLKLSLLPALAMAGIGAPGSDFGPWMAIVFGAIAGLAALHPRRRSVDQFAAAKANPAMAARTVARRQRLGGRIIPKSARDGRSEKPQPSLW
jgi:hypothetical protein